MAWLILLLEVGLVATGAWARRAKRRTVERSAWAALGGSLLLAVVLAPSNIVLQKVFGYLAMPPGLLWLGLLATTIYVWERGGPRLAAPALALWIGWTLIGNSWLTDAALAALERDIPRASIEETQELDAVLVLGGGARSVGALNELTDYGDRVMLAARLYLRKKTPLLITSGHSIGELDRESDLSAATSAIWRDLGIPEEAILRLSEPRNTGEEIGALAKLWNERGWKRVGVLSSAWHLPRILNLARKRGLAVVPIAADHRVEESTAVWHPFGLIPQMGAIRNTQHVAWELIGRAVGH